MKYFVVTTAKFATECIAYSTYGASQSNWLCNVAQGDIVLLSQFNVKAQELFGPFIASREMFYNQDRIYPSSTFFYRILMKPLSSVKVLEETFLHYRGIETQSSALSSRLIGLLQQNKHLHCITLTSVEGRFLNDAFEKYGKPYTAPVDAENLEGDLKPVDAVYILKKNNFHRKGIFEAESDFEAVLTMALRNPYPEGLFKSVEHCLNEVAPDNSMSESSVYNQFLLGNAYPADLCIVNDFNINVFELKKDTLANISYDRLKKEIQKHSFYSLFSNRIDNQPAPKRFNFFLACRKDPQNEKFSEKVFTIFNEVVKPLNQFRENKIVVLEYYKKDANGSIGLERI
jgi:hypothetical protein